MPASRPVRVAFTSDLHVDHQPEVSSLIAARARELEADVLIIAGDVSPNESRFRAALHALRPGAPRVAFVAGNHDLWCLPDAPDSRRRYLEILPELCREAGVDCLHDAPLVLDGVTVAGQTGWYDFSLRDPALDVPLETYRKGRLGRLAWSDVRFIRWPDEHEESLTFWMAARLEQVLREAPRDRPLVAVLHMLPFDELAPHKPLPWGFVRGFLGATRLGDAITVAAADGAPVAAVIAGHTHFARRAIVELGGRDVVAETSPIGYPREYRRFGLQLIEQVTARVRLFEVA